MTFVRDVTLEIASILSTFPSENLLATLDLQHVLQRRPFSLEEEKNLTQFHCFFSCLYKLTFHLKRIAFLFYFGLVKGCATARSLCQ